MSLLLMNFSFFRLGMPQQGFSGARPVPPAAGLRPPARVPIPSQTDDAPQLMPQKSRVPVLKKHLVHQLSKEEQSSLNSKFQEATDADKKVLLFEPSVCGLMCTLYHSCGIKQQYLVGVL